MSDNVSTADVLKAITALTKTVEEYHGDFREFRGETTVRVDALEAEQKSNALWLKVQAICIVPIVGGLHQVAQHFGWIK